MRRKNRQNRRETAKVAPKQQPATVATSPIIPVGVVPVTAKVRSRVDLSKEVSINVIHGGKLKNGEQRYDVSIRIDNRFIEKVSSTAYAMAGIDADNKRLYIWETATKDGYKLVEYKEGPTCFFKFFCNDKSFWNGIKGSYPLQKDPASGLYFIYYGREE